MMASKDYYAILMVHPKAATFLIEAAYKRLAREYHPDVRQTADNHEKMVEINEAYAVLSDPTRRRSYDEEYARQARRQQHAVSVAQAQPVPPPNPVQTARQAADPMRRDVCPAPPTPAAFGIDASYLERAREGAQAWQRREHRIPPRVKWITRLICSLVGLTISLLLFGPQGLGRLALFAWFSLPLVGELTLRMIEKIRDAHLLRYKFNPLYNPNPAGFQAYVQAQAQYEADTVVVYVARDAVFHTQKTCPGLSRYEPMPRWFAVFQNSRPCARCKGSVNAAPHALPPPFG